MVKSADMEPETRSRGRGPRAGHGMTDAELEAFAGRGHDVANAVWEADPVE